MMNTTSSYSRSDGQPSRNARKRTSTARWIAHGLAVFTSAVFLDSLRFKFTNAPKTQIIFGDLNQWAASFGADGLFAPSGLFSQYVIGGAELVASLILIATVFLSRHRFLQPLGAMLGVAIMSGAISFHLLTPLGINVDGDGGSLFFTACGTWIACVALLFLRRHEIGVLANRVGAFLAPAN
ncbi:MAG: hypothetical protein ABL957_15130 [Parvularculaceae bacterium]